MPKLYESRAWLWRKLKVERMTPEDIAKLCNVHHTTIYRQMEKHGLGKKK